MTDFIVWELVENEGWEPYFFDTLEQADNFMNRDNKDENTIVCVLTKKLM